MRARRALWLVDAVLSTVDETVLPPLSRGLARLRARAARWWRRARLPAAVVVAAAAVTLLVVVIRPDQPAAPGTSPVWVGVREGDQVPVYLRLSAARLAALAAEDPDRVVYALVSFAHYLTPDEVAAAVAAASGVSAVTAHGRVPLPGRQTQLVTLTAIRLPEDLLISMAEVAETKEADAQSYADRARDEPAGPLRDIYESNAQVARAEADAYRQACACVYGLVVRGSVTALMGLAALPDVRAVDPAPDVADPRQAVFAPLLPEHVDRVTPPVDEALPTGG
ncbi:MAG: hypothetical protein K6U09_03145 [Acidobacteriia bacterium]|nr:hypothetical protein [Terriglobia bacterium]